MAKKKEKEVCGKCFYCEPIGKDAGECYRNPPAPDGAGGSTADVGPVVNFNRRACGEFK